MSIVFSPGSDAVSSSSPTCTVPQMTIALGSNFIRRTAIMGDLLWKPFQSRFSDLLERLHKHQIWFETETMIQQHDAITQHHATFLDYLKQTEQKTAVARRKEIQQKEKETGKKKTDRATAKLINVIYQQNRFPRFELG